MTFLKIIHPLASALVSLAIGLMLFHVLAIAVGIPGDLADAAIAVFAFFVVFPIFWNYLVAFPTLLLEALKVSPEEDSR